MIKTFISHSSTDHPFVEWLKTKLERENLGLDIFVDDGSVFVGDDPQKMIDEVKRSIIFIPVLSNESVKKEFVQNELKTANENETTYILPIKLKCDKENIPKVVTTEFIAFDKVEGKIYEDFSNEKEWDIHYEHLRKAIFNRIVELGLLKEDTKDFYQDCEHLDSIIQREDPTILEIKTVIDVYLKKEPYQRYFFSKLANVKWLKYLKLYGYLKANPQPIEAQDSPGSYIIPQWHALEYLEKVSKQISSNEEAVGDLLEIIKSVSHLKDAAGRHVDNYRTWYYFLKILLNLPNERITEEIIDLIPVWLDSNFDTSLPGEVVAGKLLPKFLDSSNPEDWKKGERIIEIITDIKWVQVPEKQRNIYEREMEPKTVIEPYWLKEGLENHFERIGEVCSTNVINGITKKILCIFGRNYRNSKDVRYEDKDYEIGHSLLENGQHHISVNSIKYPENWDGFSREKIERTPLLSFDISDFKNEVDFITNVKGVFVEKHFTFLKTEFDNVLSSIYFLDDYSYVWWSSLNESFEHMNIEDTEKVLTFILKEILGAKAKFNKEETGKVLDKFLSKEYPYPLFKRIVLFVASREWDKYKEYFFKAMDLEEIRIFEESDYESELSVLLQENIGKFNLDEKAIIRTIIETGPEWLNPENPEKYKIYWKHKWLYLLKDDPLLKPLYEEQKKLTGIEKEEFSYGTKFKTSEGFGPSPLTKEEMLSLTNADLAIRTKEFRSEKKWEGMTVGGFSITLKEAVMANPSKFTGDLNPFEDVGFVYVYKILDGLKDSWKEKKTIEWGKIFDFIAPYIKKGQFWGDKYVVEPDTWLGGADHKWIMGIIAELMQEGTRDDSWAFPEEHGEKARDVIFTLLKEPETEKEELTDYVTYTLNTPCGKLITALVYLALRIARVNGKKGIRKEPKWDKQYKDKYDEMLEQEVIEAYTDLGRYLPNLAYLDRRWVTDKVTGLASESGSKLWEAFIDGYLSIGRVYDDLYGMMRPYYQYGLSYSFKKEKRNREHLIQHICIGYLGDHEKLDDPHSLFRKIIDGGKPEQIREMARFFEKQREYLTKSSEENERMKGKIIEFWRHLYGKYKGRDDGSLTKEDKKILSSISRLAVFLPKIDTESYEWLLLSATYVREDFNSSFFIKSLDGLKDKGDSNETAKYIGDIYLKMLETGTPDYDKVNIRSVVEFLYKAGATESANKICNTYGSRGSEFLRDIYERCSNKT